MSQGFDILDSFLAVALCLIAACARLWTISQPPCVIFDEVHFGNFSKWYVLNQFHFDIHPPLGKMLMGYIAKATQYKGDIENFITLGTDYRVNETSYISQRQTPALFSAMVSPLLYCALRNFGIAQIPSFGAGIFVCLESSMIVESKFILSDGMLHFFSALHVFTFALFLRTQKNLHVLIAGVTLGLAASCKLTALGLVALDGITQVFWIFIKRPDIVSIIIRATLLLGPMFIVVFAVWIVHFAMTPYDGHHWFYIKPKDKHTIIEKSKINTTYWGNRVSNSLIIPRIIRWNQVMNRINMRSNCPHPWSSSPQYWPFLMDKWVSFYSQSSDRRIQCFGLPSAYWLSTASIIATPVLLLFKRADWKNLVCCLGWAVSYFPFLSVPRTMFHYHYIVPLMFAIMNQFALVDCFFKNNKKAKGYATIILTFVDVLCYFYFTPFIYGTPCPNCWNSRRFVKRWTEGPPKPLNYFAKNIYKTKKMFVKLPQ